MSNRSRENTGARTEPDVNNLRPELTDEQWSLISDLFPDVPMGPRGGRPRDCFEGILWVLRTGARWKDLPSHFPSNPICWRRFAEWSNDGVWDVALSRLLAELDRRGKINWEEGFADGTFSPAKKKGDLVDKTRRGKGTKIMALVDGNGLPLAIDIESANCSEVRLIEPLIDSAMTRYVPNKLIYDRAADSDGLRDRLADRNIELICPHRRGRVRPSRQDGRKLRRYRRRWKMERSISWLHAFRRLVTRYEFYSFLFHSFAKIACLIIALRRF